jgi:hypothetical protein
MLKYKNTSFSEVGGGIIGGIIGFLEFAIYNYKIYYL